MSVLMLYKHEVFLSRPPANAYRKGIENMIGNAYLGCRKNPGEAMQIKRLT